MRRQAAKGVVSLCAFGEMGGGGHVIAMEKVESALHFEQNLNVLKDSVEKLRELIRCGVKKILQGEY